MLFHDKQVPLAVFLISVSGNSWPSSCSGQNSGFKLTSFISLTRNSTILKILLLKYIQHLIPSRSLSFLLPQWIVASLTRLLTQLPIWPSCFLTCSPAVYSSLRSDSYKIKAKSGCLSTQHLQCLPISFRVKAEVITMAYKAPNSTIPSVWQIFSSPPLGSLYSKYLGYWINIPCMFSPLGPFSMLIPVAGMLAPQMTICSTFCFLQIFAQLSVNSSLSFLSKINLYSHYPISPFPALFFPKHFSPSDNLFIYFYCLLPIKM